MADRPGRGTASRGAPPAWAALGAVFGVMATLLLNTLPILPYYPPLAEVFSGSPNLHQARVKALAAARRAAQPYVPLRLYAGRAAGTALDTQPEDGTIPADGGSPESPRK